MQGQIRGVLNKPGTGARVWRNNVGKKKIDGKWFSWGLAVGSADLIGIHQVLITPEMVGDVIGQFLSVECKRSGGGVISAEQEIWAKTIRSLGGVAEFWDNPAHAKAFLAGRVNHDQ